MLERCATVMQDGVEVRRFRPGMSVSIGRHTLNDVVIPDPTISRFHATLRWSPAYPSPLVYDHGSQNGTLLDELRVDFDVPQPLRDGAVLSVGVSQLTIELQNREGPALLHGVVELLTLFTEEGPELAGSYADGQALQKVIQRLEVERRTGTLSITPDAPVPGGSLTLCVGRIMAVQLGRAWRTRALQHVLELHQPGRYRFTGEFAPTEEPMELWLSSYLRERHYTRRTEPLRVAALSGRR